MSYNDIIKLGTEYLKYEREGGTKWQCVDKISDTFEREDDATNFCDKIPTCRYIENKNCLGVDGFQPCTSLQKSSKSCVLQRRGSRFKNAQYQEYELEGRTKWNCRDPINSYDKFDDAMQDCNQNPSCNYIENEDCSDQDFQTCSLLNEDNKSCAFEKKGAKQFGAVIL